MFDSVDFGELPQALVKDVIEQTEGLEHELLQSFEDWRTKRDEWRKQLNDEELLKRASDLPDAKIPTTCGIDGSHAVERLLATDVVAAGAVAVEGFTPPSNQSHWERPWHRVYIETEVHNPHTSTILRAVMLGMELILAEQAPHDLILLDGSFATPFISFNQGFGKAKDHATLNIVNNYLAQNIKSFFQAYHNVLKSDRTDFQRVAVPKYTDRHEIGSILKNRDPSFDDSYDDRGLLSYLLNTGEYTNPVKFEKPSSPWHLDTSEFNNFTTQEEQNEIKELVEHIKGYLENIYILYYRPRVYMPALRLEINKSIAENPYRLSIVLKGIEMQAGKASIIEPYPLYMADRMVRHLPQALPNCLHRISHYLAKNYQGNMTDVFIGLHSYRTESGR